MRTACAADIQKFCASIERAKGAMRACLEQNQTSLSSECNAARAERAAATGKGQELNADFSGRAGVARRPGLASTS